MTVGEWAQALSRSLPSVLLVRAVSRLRCRWLVFRRLPFLLWVVSRLGTPGRIRTLAPGIRSPWHIPLSGVWPRSDSNRHMSRYERGALTIELRGSTPPRTRTWTRPLRRRLLVLRARGVGRRSGLTGLLDPLLAYAQQTPTNTSPCLWIRVWTSWSQRWDSNPPPSDYKSDAHAW